MLPTESDVRKKIPVTTGVLDYFPDAIAYVAMVSYLGNEQHNPGQPLHWAREKSADHPNCIGRHLIQRKQEDGGVIEAGQVAWRALADLQLMLEFLQSKGVDIWAPIRAPKTETSSDANRDDYIARPVAHPTGEDDGPSEAFCDGGGRGAV